MDMNVFQLFLLSNALLELFGGVLGESQEIRFNLKDPESNEVISLGQKNVALVCHITNTANADITIRNVAGEIVATNLNGGNCLEHTITRLTENDNGNYVCQVMYSDDVTMVTTGVEKALLLNVESGNQQCFRNGTSSQAFGVGDTLLLSCYCTSTINCNWISTVEGTGIGISIPVYETVEFDDSKRIIRIVVGPLLSNDTKTRYDCYYGSLSEQRCDIGPTTTSSNDFVLNAVNPRTILRECPRSDTSSVTPVVPGNTARGDGETETTTPTSGTTIPTSKQGETTTVRPEENSFLIYIIIAVVLFILFLLVIVLIIIVFCRRREKKGNEGDGLQKSMKKSPNNNMAYDASDAARIDGDPEKHMDQPLPDVISHDDNSPYGVSGVSGVRNVRDNGSADPKEVQYASVNRHKMAEVSHYGLRSAVLVDQENEEDDEEFFSGEVTEYRVPVAFRAEEDFEISHGGENFDAQELPLRYS